LIYSFIHQPPISAQTLNFAPTPILTRLIQIQCNGINHVPISTHIFLGAVEGGGTQFVLNPNGGRGTVRPSQFDDTVPPQYLENLMTDVRSAVLPFTLQSHWNCDADTSIKKRDRLVLETSKVSVTITPEVNGKIWSMHDKVNDREMIQNKGAKDKQRAFANIGTHKRWGSGGVEYNFSGGGYIGHSAFAERETFAAKFDTEKGPVVRVWEFDRFNYSTWQVDVLVQDNIVWMHPRLMNPHDHELPAYWWTCVANFARGKDRFISPATGTGQTEAGPIRFSPWPYMAGVLNSTFVNGDGVWQIDHSFLENIVWGDFFVDVPKELDKWVQLTNEDGYSVFHGHPNEGSKIFVWGNSGNARFMQRFLANFPEDPDSGNYVELQTGLMRTQSQQAMIEAKKGDKFGTREWTEYFTAWVPKNKEEVETLRGDIYENAVNLTHDRSIELIPRALRAEMDDFFKSISGRAIKKEEITHYGSPWGALHLKLLEKAGLPSYSPQTPFLFEDDKISHDVRPWDDLLTIGTFSPESLAAIPSSFQVGQLWEDLLNASMVKYGATWLHLYHLSVIDMEKGGVDRARVLLKQSIGLKPTPHAYRSLGLLSKNEQEALPLLYKAWELALETDKTMKNRDRLVYYIGSEILSYLQQAALRGLPGFKQELQRFVEKQATRSQVPASLLTTDQFISSQVAIALWTDRPQDALDILNDDGKNCFPTYGRQRTELLSYWHQANIAIEKKKVGRDLTILEQRNVRVSHPQNRRIGCPYSEWYCLGYW